MKTNNNENNSFELNNSVINGTLKNKLEESFSQNWYFQKQLLHSEESFFEILIFLETIASSIITTLICQSALAEPAKKRILDIVIVKKQYIMIVRCYLY